MIIAPSTSGRAMRSPFRLRFARTAVCAFVFAAVSSSIFGQNQILTASAFFKQVSDYYATINDMQAAVQMTIQKTNMNANLSYKKPGLLRLDFTSPKDQVFLFDGDALTIYLPGRQAILKQSASRSGAGLATPQGLALMSRYYTVAYETGQTPVALPGTEEMVINLILSRKTFSEEFKTIKLSINPTLRLIRRVEAVTVQNETMVMTFSNYSLNSGISDQRFIYDSPASANNYENFLFSE
jgi:outer membrane lipoprotein-sorting protein